MTDKSLIGIGVAAVVTPLLAFWLAGGLGGGSKNPTAGAVAAQASNQARAASASNEVKISKLTMPPKPPATPAPAVNVTPADLENLARMVSLVDAPQQDFKKEQWEKAIPVAEKLMNNGSCDCEQRNWLTQFIAAGNMAISGSEEYYQHAQFLATLYRDDKELQTGQPSN